MLLPLYLLCSVCFEVLVVGGMMLMVMVVVVVMVRMLVAGVVEASSVSCQCPWAEL